MKRQVKHHGGLVFFGIACVSALAVLLLGMYVSCRRNEFVPTSFSFVDTSSVAEDSIGLFKIRYRLKWLHQAQFAGVYMAKEKGFYLARGLDVEILQGGLDNPPYKSLIEGDSDISDMNLITALINYDKGPPLVNLAQISQKNCTYLVGKKSSGIRSIQDLRGKKVGVWRDEAGEHVRLFLESLDIDINIIPVDWSVNLLLNDAIDMMNVMSYNEYHRILMAGLDKDELVAFDLKDYHYDLVDDGIYATKPYYDRYTKQCQDFAEATLQGWKYALNHRGEALNLVLRYLRESHLPANPEHQNWMLSFMPGRILENPSKAGFLEERDFDLVQSILLDGGLVKQAVKYEEFYPNAREKKD
jgi:NitT/TauT family transport system substrate-binding protein